MTVLCVICGEREPQPVVCVRCEDRIRDDLTAAGRLRRDLATWAEIDPGTPGTDQRHLLALVDSPVMTSRGAPDLRVMSATDRRSKPQPLAHEHPRADHVDNVDAMLLGWARLCCEERGLSEPLADVFDVLRVLTVSRDWLARHPAVAEWRGELRDCVLALRRLSGDMPERVIGRCPDVDPDGERDACSGPLRLEYAGPLPEDVERVNAPSGVRCGRCGARWDSTPEVMVQFLRVVRPQARFPVPRDWVVREYQHLGLSHALLRKWVQRGHVYGYADGQVDLVGVLARVSGNE